MNSDSETMPAAWFYAENNEKIGPIEFKDALACIASGIIKSDTLVWKTGNANWMPAAEAPELQAHLAESRPEEGASNTEIEPKLKLRSEESASFDAESKSREPKCPLTAEQIMQSAHGPPARESEDLEMEDISSFRMWFFNSSVELKFTLALIPVIPILMALDMSLMMSVFAWGLLVSIFGGIIFRVRTFQENVIWGIGGMVIPGMDLIFTIKYFGRVWRSLAMGLAVASVMGIMYAMGDPDPALTVLEEILGSHTLHDTSVY